jgi:hypothetical protein
LGWQLVTGLAGRKTGIETQLLSEAYWIPALLSAVVLFAVLKTNFWSSLTGLLLSAVLMASLLPTKKIIEEVFSERIIPLLSDELIISEKSLAPDDLNLLNKWIHVNTLIDDRFTSNVFCPWTENGRAERCEKENWWFEDRESQDQNGAFNNGCVGVGSRQEYFINFWLPAVTERRFLLQGPDYLVGCRKNPDWIADAIRLSEAFGRKGDEETCAQLVDYGMGWFVRDTRIQKSASFSHVPLFKTASFEVYKLSKDLCTAG